jgi:hypothetical protein
MYKICDTNKSGDMYVTIDGDLRLVIGCKKRTNTYPRNEYEFLFMTLGKKFCYIRSTIIYDNHINRIIFPHAWFKIESEETLNV